MRNYTAILMILSSFLTGNVAMSQQPIRAITTVEVADNGVEARQEAIDEVQRNVWRTKVTFRCEQMPLSEAMKQLAKRADCAIHIAWGKLVRADTLVSIDVRDVSLHSTLVMMLRPHQLAYIPAENEIVITDEKTSIDFVTTKYYDTTPLLPKGHGPNPGLGFITRLIEDVLDRYWPDLGLEGNGSVDGFRNTLIVRQRPEIQWEIDQLLAQLKTAKDLPDVPYSGIPLRVSQPINQVEAITDKLHSTRISGQMNSATCSEVMKKIEQTMSIPVCAINSSLERTPLLANEGKLSVHWDDCTVWQALDQFTSKYEAGWRIVDDRIEITSATEANYSPVIRVYPVRDLIWYGMSLTRDTKRRATEITNHSLLFRSSSSVPPPSPDFVPDIPRLPNIHELEYEIFDLFPEEWDGPRRVEWFSEADCLVIATTLPWHEKIEAYLNHLRESRPTVNPDEFLTYLDKLEAEFITVTYQVREVNGEQELSPKILKNLANDLRSNIAPESWNENDALITTTKEKLLLRNRRDIILRSIEFLENTGGLREYVLP